MYETKVVTAVIRWTQVRSGDPTRLHGVLVLESDGISKRVGMHMDAFASRDEDFDESQLIENEDDMDEFDRWVNAVRPDNGVAMDTLRIHDRSYIVFASPREIGQ